MPFLPRAVETENVERCSVSRKESFRLIRRIFLSRLPPFRACFFISSDSQFDFRQQQPILLIDHRVCLCVCQARLQPTARSFLRKTLTV